MPFNYLSTVIITEADTQPQDAETRGRTQANGKRKGAATGGDGGTGGRGTSKISRAEKSQNVEL